MSCVLIITHVLVSEASVHDSIALGLEVAGSPSGCQVTRGLGSLPSLPLDITH